MDKIGHQRERIPGRALPGTRFKPEHKQRQQQQRLFMALGFHVLGGPGGAGRTRRKPIPGGSMAPSMGEGALLAKH
ncbi:hypothetical protein, partial [Stenotrophomonas sp. AR026]|uniref:hypothetical protein n=1 Tax=Stenotrophomonas sp. AR026 TaxID=3398462 RepID=UPI003BB052F4